MVPRQGGGGCHVRVPRQGPAPTIAARAGSHAYPGARCARGPIAEIAVRITPGMQLTAWGTNGEAQEGRECMARNSKLRSMARGPPSRVWGQRRFGKGTHRWTAAGRRQGAVGMAARGPRRRVAGAAFPWRHFGNRQATRRSTPARSQARANPVPRAKQLNNDRGVDDARGKGRCGGAERRGAAPRAPSNRRLPDCRLSRIRKGRCKGLAACWQASSLAARPRGIGYSAYTLCR